MADAIIDEAPADAPAVFGKRNAVARLVDGVARDRTPGAFAYQRSSSGTPIGILYRCPCECGGLGVLRFARADVPPGGAAWTWDGDRERPTLAPAVRRRTCGWRGVLQMGMFVEIVDAAPASVPAPASTTEA